MAEFACSKIAMTPRDHSRAARNAVELARITGEGRAVSEGNELRQFPEILGNRNSSLAACGDNKFGYQRA
jgi:hypothetical protein